MDYGSWLKKHVPNPSRRSKHHAKQSAFEGSIRQLRGKIIKALLKGARSELMLGRYISGHSARMASVLNAMLKEGLIAKKGSTWRIAR
jgi:A/G-specific adenine glycosylase